MSDLESLTTDWRNLYGESWKGLITDEAFAHPAKFSRALIAKIYQHLLDEKLIQPGDTVLDPFGGVALGGFNAMRLGLHWVGMELEEKFHTLGNGNIELWQKQYPWFPGTATLLNGDSRKLAQALAQADGAISSPPYADGSQHTGRNDPRPEFVKGGKIVLPGLNGSAASIPYAETVSAAITSPPYDQARIDGQGDEGASGLRNEDGSFVRGAEGWELRKAQGGRYGDTDGNLANLPSGDFGAAISSPPFMDQGAGDTRPWGGMKEQPQNMGNYLGGITDYGQTDGQLGTIPAGDFDGVITSPPFGEAQTGGGINKAMRGEEGYNLTTRLPSNSYSIDEHGDADGQLGVMKMDDFDGAITSPPYESSDQNYKEGWARFHANHEPLHKNDIQREAHYGETDGQMGNTGGDSFWHAAREIVEQVYLLLAPGAPAVWVVKDYVRNKQIVPFCDQWRQLCEAVGFETLHLHRAWLVEERGTQYDLLGEKHTKTVERKSFFRRLAEKKGSPRIDWEMVICMRKPAPPSGGGE